MSAKHTSATPQSGIVETVLATICQWVRLRVASQKDGGDIRSPKRWFSTTDRCVRPQRHRDIPLRRTEFWELG
ncbi:hypothetical protein SKAU_G00238500 [Synaphobranchus kaupii]|uniref:Uncharacterized protein n=1 Tax=Synaphobranchus kaupii TaxID=118154 RepID=A0A9Q1IU02_SYNKA|nr:hypothetical protein SKAU_G00238500 [Synaphobranchus kaupii]